eukprot:scaffold65577_cov66-Phaeocystis_antarctica.AAC.2
MCSPYRAASAAKGASKAAALTAVPFRLRPSTHDNSAGSAPLSSAAASARQPASWISVTPVGGGAPAGDGGGGATRTATPSSPNGLHMRLSFSSAGSRRKAGARATSPASPVAAL